MANVPERPIERLLRGAAKKRRDEAGAPLELHPASRRLLQGEVARKYHRVGREGRSFFQVVGQLLPRFAWGLSVLAVLVAAGWVLLLGPAKNESTALLAKNEPILKAVPLKKAVPPTLAGKAETPAPSAPAPDASPTAVTGADASQSVRREPASQSGSQRQSVPMEIPAAQSDGEVREQLALAAAPPSVSRNTPPAAAVGGVSEMPAPAPAVVAGGSFDRPAESGVQPAAYGSMPAAPAAPSPVLRPPTVGRAVTADAKAKAAADSAGQAGFAYKSPLAVASATSPQPSPAAMDRLLAASAAGGKELGSSSVTQHFEQVARGPVTKASPADKAVPAHPVLASFRVEQVGQKLRIIDGDGSVYSGYLQFADSARRARVAKPEAAATAASSRTSGAALAENAAASLDSDRLAPLTYSFRVTGTNRSLQKQVVFTGNLLHATNLALITPPSNYLSIGGGLAGSQDALAQPVLQPLLKSRITGKMVIGTGKPVEINALSTIP